LGNQSLFSNPFDSMLDRDQSYKACSDKNSQSGIGILCHNYHSNTRSFDKFLLNLDGVGQGYLSKLQDVFEGTLFSLMNHFLLACLVPFQGSEGKGHTCKLDNELKQFLYHQKLLSRNYSDSYQCNNQKIS